MLSIPYDQFGEQSDNSETIHFAHANGFPPRTYSAFLNALSSDYDIKAIHHQPLWSKTDPWETLHSWHQIADDLITFCDEHQINDAIGIGHSLGGVATMYTALKRPDIFRKIILIEPVFLPREVTQLLRSAANNPEQVPLVAGALRRRDFWTTRDDAFQRFRTKALFSRFSNDALWDYVNYALIETEAKDGFTLAYPKQWEARFFSLAPSDIWDLIPQITTPTLGIRATGSDTIFSSAWGDWQAAQPTATFMEVEDVGHLLLQEKPLVCANIVKNWLG